MDLTSQVFLFYFLPFVLALYYLVGPKLRIFALLVASFFFYAKGEGLSLSVLLCMIGANYLLGILIDRCTVPSRRFWAVSAAVVVNLSILFVFKYLAFFAGILSPLLQLVNLGPVHAPQVHQPLGISFMTFQAVSYVMDVYHETSPAERNLIRFSLFLALFAKIGAGPIARFSDMEHALSGPDLSFDNFIDGARRVIIGLGKKLILADTLALTADQIFAIPFGELTGATAWLGIICYTLQLYFDFSGYSDMAIGLGRMFGFTLPENFNYPYLAKSLTEFWRRWHISLSSWFRDYLFIPLSFALMTEGARRKVAQNPRGTNYRSLFAIFAVFTLCGLWHGANWNFVVWGMLHGAVLALESWRLGKLLKKAWAPLAHLYLLLVVAASWVFFRLPTLSGALYFLRTLAGFGASTGGLSQLRIYVSIELLIVLGMALLGAVPWVSLLTEGPRGLSRLSGRLGSWIGNCSCHLVPALEPLFLAAVCLASLQAVTGSNMKHFIYAQF